MKAWLLDRIGDGVSGLRMADVPDPAPGEGDVVLRVLLAALNPADRYLAEGQYPARPAVPHILGRDAVGVVEAVGPAVEGVRAGDRRIVLRGATGVERPGTLAERVAVAAGELVEVPAGWTDEQAAGATLVYLTAYQALTQWGDLPAGAVVLVTGASGGVGVAAIQLARAMGLRVLALSRGTAKRDALLRLGAEAVFDAARHDWAREAKAHLGQARVDLAVDNVGGPPFAQVLDTLGFGGRVSCVGMLAGPVPAFNTASLFFRRLRLGGVAVGTYGAAEARRAWAAVTALLDGTGARPLVDRVFPFDQLPAAFARLADGPLGKVLLKVT